MTGLSTLKVYAQGDIVLLQIADAAPLPVGVDAIEPLVLAIGEATGHRHAFYGGATMRRAGMHPRGVAREAYLGHVSVAPGGALLEHGPGPGVRGDHYPIHIPAGTFIALRQREYVSTTKHGDIVAD